MLVPVRLGLYRDDVFTLWEPSRRAGPGRFLGRGGRLIGYRSPAELAAFLRTDDDHDLARRPGVGRAPADLDVVELARAHRYALDGVWRFRYDGPDRAEAAELTATFELAGRLAETYGLDAVTAVLAAVPLPVRPASAPARLTDRRGAYVTRPPRPGLATAIETGWASALAAIERLVIAPPVGRVALAAAQWEARGRARPALDTDPAEFWRSCEIEPFGLDLGDGPLLSLRAAAGFRFLGRDGRLLAFRDDAALSAWIAGAGFDGHDLAGYPGLAMVRERVRLGPLPAPAGDRVVDLAGAVADFARDPVRADPALLTPAVDLLTALGRWRREEDETWAFRRSAVVTQLVDPGRGPVRPVPPFDTEIARFRALLADLRSRTDLPTPGPSPAGAAGSRPGPATGGPTARPRPRRRTPRTPPAPGCTS